MKLCPVSRKHRHKSSGKAEAQRRSILERIDPTYDGKVYLCWACHDWHVGRPSERSQ